MSPAPKRPVSQENPLDRNNTQPNTKQQQTQRKNTKNTNNRDELRSHHYSHSNIQRSSRPRPNTAVAMALDNYYLNKIEAMKQEILKGQAVIRRLEAQRNDYNSRVRLLREERGLLQQPGSYVGEVVMVMSTKM